jgi:hypothetical protein
MFELEAGTSTSVPAADRRMSEVGADRCVSQLEVDRSTPAEAVDSTPRAAEERSIEQARSTYMGSAVSGRRSMTSLLVCSSLG